MVLPLFSIPESTNLKVGDSYSLDGPEGKHAAAVRRMRVGEGIQLTNGTGLRVTGKVSSTNSNSLVVFVEEVNQEDLPTLKLTLVQALAKGDRDELAVQAATELGALTIIPWQSLRSVSRWEGEKAEKGRIRWQTIAQEAAKQSLRVFCPSVRPVASTKQLISLLADYDEVLILEPTGSASIAELPSLTGDVALVVGPEGGIDPTELERFVESGFKVVHLGAGVLRTSTAGMAAISFLAGSNGLWA